MATKVPAIEGMSYRHLKTGRCYVVLHLAHLEFNGAQVVVYRAIAGGSTVWVRPRLEFEDGRFILMGSEDHGTNGRG